jgi:hypothetical protein
VVLVLLKAWRAERNWHAVVDFPLYYSGAWLARHGQSPYDFDRLRAACGQLGFSVPVGPLMSLPIPTLLILVPMTFAEPRVALGLWVLVSGAAFSGAALLVCGHRRRHWVTPALLVGAGLPGIFWPTQYTLTMGQVNAITLLALAAALWATARGRHGTAGVAIGLATLTKLGPGLLIIYLLVRRQFRAAATALGTVAAGIAGAVVWLGPGVLIEYPRTVAWIQRRHPALMSDSPQNLSLASFPYRLQTLAGHHGADTGLAAHGAARLIAWLVSLILVAIAFRRGWRMRDLRQALVLLIPTYLLAMPLAESHHAAVMLLVYWEVLSLAQWPGWRVVGLAAGSILLLDLHRVLCGSFLNRSPVSIGEIVASEAGTLGIVLGLLCIWFLRPSAPCETGLDRSEERSYGSA